MLPASPLVRLFWKVVESAPNRDLLSLPDQALVAMLMRQVSERALLEGEEINVLYGYIASKIPLIRDTASF